MKKILVAVFLLGGSFGAFAQITCPEIHFTYDASGNRIKRQLVITNCNEEKKAQPQEPEVVIPANVYPNPCKDKINIDFDSKEGAVETKVELMDVNGRIVCTYTSSSLQNQIDVTPYPAGNYLLKVIRGKDQRTFNVSKN
ncbi:MAG: T9SS type A sorting domain-containing protein [Bacteroidetes bacterium]|nr:MAG: T9SS type A sorting domain-containing protein [Bacteroidota bacterium]